jgi:hypothetical protein
VLLSGSEGSGRRRIPGVPITISGNSRHWIDFSESAGSLVSVVVANYLVSRWMAAVKALIDHHCSMEIVQDEISTKCEPAPPE